MAKDYYQILGLEKNASKEDVKKAFHKMAHKYHPDKAGGDEAKFKEVNEAYQVLSDNEKRSRYDQFGNADAGAGFGGFSTPGGSAAGWDFSGFSGADGFNVDLSDIFSEFFGGGQSGRRMQRGRDIAVDVQISFKEGIFGTTRTMLINKVGVCDDCQGSGAAPGSKKKTCPTCNGKGTIRETRRSFVGSFSTTHECSACRGRGEIPEKACARCQGETVLKKNEEIKVIIPPGIQDGEMIRMSGKGEAAPGGIAGDLYIKIHTEKDPLFRRDGVNLLMDLPVRLTDALLGTEHPIKTIDGDITLKIPAGIAFGEILRVKGKGVPSGGAKRGDLLIRIVIKIPTKLSAKAKKAIEDLKEEGV